MNFDRAGNTDAIARVNLVRYQRGVVLVLLFAVLAATTFAASFAEAAISIDNSARFNDDDSAYLSRTPAGAGNRKTWTWSGWVKRGTIDVSGRPLFSQGSDGNNYGSIWFYSNDKIAYMSAAGGSFNISVQSNALLRDPAKWEHIVVSTDTTQATASERVKIYVNGSQVTSLAVATYPAQNYDTYFNSTGAHYLGREAFNITYFDGYLSDVYFIDGQALTPSSFGETDTNGYWRPKSYSGTYGTNGFKLDFANSADLGNDVSGNNNDWTSNNLDATDQVIDTPTSTFCSWNQFDKTATLSEGNLKAAATAATRSTFSIPSTGKWHFEIDITSKTYAQMGISRAGAAMAGGNSGNFGFYDNGVGTHLFYDTANTNTYLATGFFANGDTLVVDVDSDNNKVWMARLRSGTLTYMNSGQSPDPASGTAPLFGTGSASPVSTISLADGYYAGVGSGGSTETVILNCGQGGQSSLTYYSAAGGYFKSAPSSGFKALSTANLPAPAIAVPKNYFDAVIYTGTGSSRSITDLSFLPSLVWIKSRSDVYSHNLYDAVRGATMKLSSDATTVENTQTEGVTAFNSNGFTVGTLANVNESAKNYISWNWKESPTSGFDIVTYTGNGSTQNISHSLGAVPDMIIAKGRDNTWSWPVYHSALGATKFMEMNLTGAVQTSATRWNDTEPTSSVFTVGTSGQVNANSERFVAYLFKGIDGFSKFGSYTGNGSADGPFVYTGFKPRFIMIKNITTASTNWLMLDTARGTYNPISAALGANAANVESDFAATWFDALSNGFKVRLSASGVTNINTSSDTYIYAAFADVPFKYSAALGPDFEGTQLTKNVTVTGDAAVFGTISKGAGTFVIDHPLDPKNKLLYHSFVESPDVLNIYDGIATLDKNGEATIKLPKYFLALNKDFNYLGTAIGQPMPNLFISKGVHRWFFGLFGRPAIKISGGAPGGRVSWQVTGIRKDPFILANPIIVEVDKGPDQPADKGEFICPECYGN